MTSIAPCLWFDGQAEAAANFYASLFPNSSVDSVDKAPADYPGGKRGDVLTVEFTLDGRPFQGLNGGPAFPFTEAVSMAITVDNQAELDRLWDALLADGGQPVECGWLKDRWGLSWQVVPKQLYAMMRSSDAASAQRAMAAMMQMKKFDIAALEAAYNSEQVA